MLSDSESIIYHFCKWKTGNEEKMSCQLNLLSRIKDNQVLRKFINPLGDGEVSEQSQESDDWNNEDWGWGDGAESSMSAADTTSDAHTEDWLNDCEVAISPLGDLIVLSKEDRLAVLQISYEERDEGMFIVLWKGVVSEFPREEVTCVYCLPLLSYKQSSQGAPEWTCVIVGFNTGHVRMYDETGTKVLDQMIHNESVMSIKCKTYSPPRYPSSSDLSEELTILYETVLVTLDGFGLFQTLRACKNQAAMAAASGSRALELPPLGYKKWGLKNQGQASDHISAGTYTPNPFDQMQAASLAGFGEKVSAVPPTTNVYACAGDNPFVGVYHAMEGESYHLLSNVTGAASKLLSVGAAKLLSWGSSFLSKQPVTQPEPEKKKERIEPAIPVFQRYSLYDKRRIGQSMALSPYGNIAAVTDSLGRVLLVDTNAGTIKRMWKGYRNAQVGWMTVKEPSSGSRRSSNQRHALFLVIYAPKRGLLEVWLSESGPRVGAFNVGKGCRLIYPGCSLLGLNSSTYKLVKGKTIQCFLLKNGGQLMDINIPFHLALSDANSKRAHDQQLMKSVKTALRETTHDSEAMWKLMSKMKLVSSLQMALDKILSTDNITAATSLTIIENIIKLIKKSNSAQQRQHDDGDDDEAPSDQQSKLDVESRLLLEFCQSRVTLIQLYSKLLEYNENQPTPSKLVDLSTVQPVDEVSSLLMLRIPGMKARRVGFSADDCLLTLSQFLVLCESQPGHLTMLRIKHKLTDTQMMQLGQVLFEPVLKNHAPLDELLSVVAPLKLSARFLLDLLLTYYLSLTHPSDSHLPILESILTTLHNMDNNEPDQQPDLPEEQSAPSTPLPSLPTPSTSPVLQYDQDKAPFPPPQTTKAPWWTYIRDRCESSLCLRSYLHIAVTCRSICIKETQALPNKFVDQMEEDFSKPLPDKQSDEPGVPGQSSPSEEWEHVCVDVAMWNLSIRHLEDMVTLNTLLQCNLKREGEKQATNPHVVTVKEIKTGNKGLVGELVGRWCVNNKLSPADNLRYETASSAKQGDQTKDTQEPYMKVKESFPLSLMSDIIYANACWEYASQWNKDIECLSHFRSSLAYLNQIENGCLRHGLCVMMWRIYLFKRVSSLVSLIEKVGKAPKDRLCKKEIEMDTATTTEFMNIVCDYMDVFLQANCDFGEADLYKQETSWADETTGHSLVEMACQQKETNYRLIKHHSHLFTIITALLVFSIKAVKIMTLFDNNGVAAFFKELNSHPYLGNEGKNEVVASNRKEFLCRVLRHAVQSLPGREAMVTSASSSVRIDKECDGMKWPHHVITLAEAFELDTDILRQFHAVQLVSHGYDVLALEVLPLMQAPSPAYAEILELCAQRFVYHMFKLDETKTVDMTGAASPSLLDWISDKDYSGLAYLAVPISETNTLLLNILKGLKAQPDLHKYAEELYTLTATEAT